MFNKELLKKKNKREVLEFTKLEEKIDKFSGSMVLTSSKRDFKLFPEKNVSSFISNIRLSLETIENKTAFYITWQFFLHGGTQQGVISTSNRLTCLNFLFYAGDIEKINFEESDFRKFSEIQKFEISENLILRLIREETLDIRVESTNKTKDYHQSECKKLQVYLKEQYENMLDFKEYELLQSSGKLDEVRDKEFPKPVKKPMSMVVKLGIIFQLLVLILFFIFDKDSLKENNTSTSTLEKLSPNVSSENESNNNTNLEKDTNK